MRILFAGIVALASVAPSMSGQTTAPDPWAPVRFLIGTWEGTTDGQAGHGTMQRQYRFVMRDRFIEVRNTSTYPPQEKNKKGEVHEDAGYISYDRARHRLVLRQFHVEGFVNQYVQDDPAAGKLSFTSEAIENIAPGWRARETYTFHPPDEMEETFELAAPGKDFELYSHARLKRSRR